ncbi:MAG TPA: hypothetical protein VKB35_06785, partial [Ktedonobacteraceae bacterium]|nr:hypothetical protein [Ktedonobacteraceae bacterium]
GSATFWSVLGFVRPLLIMSIHSVIQQHYRIYWKWRIVPAYVTFESDLAEQIRAAAKATTPGLEHVMCFNGVGNHGGGPTKAHIEYIRTHTHAFPGIELRFSTPELFYAAVRASWDVLPVVTADLELQHTFPGCYSVMHDIKQRQRATEHLLAQSERVIDAFVSAY